MVCGHWRGELPRNRCEGEEGENKNNVVSVQSEWLPDSSGRPVAVYTSAAPACTCHGLFVCPGGARVLFCESLACDSEHVEQLNSCKRLRPQFGFPLRRNTVYPK